MHGKLLLDVLESDTVNDPSFISAFTALSIGAARYLSNIYEHGGVYFSDLMHSSQFIFGTTADDPEQKLYLIDIEPRYRKFADGLHDIHDLMHLLTYSRQQKYFINAVEEDNGGVHFEEAHMLLVALQYKLNKSMLKKIPSTN